MTKKTQAPLKIVEFRAENTKRLKAVTIRPDPDASVVVLTGKNRQGKTSVIDAIWVALGGKSAIPSKPIRTGEKEATVSLDLGEFVVERKITEKGAYLRVATKDGMEPKSVQGFLDSRLGNMASNPLSFMRLSPDKQVVALQSMVNLKLDLNEFSEVSGLPTAGAEKADPIKVLDDAYSYLFKQRTEVNREVTRLEGLVKSLAAQIPPGKETAQPVSAQELIAERQALMDIHISNNKQRQQLIQGEEQYDQQAQAIEKIDSDIADLQAKITKLQEQRFVFAAEHDNLKAKLADMVTVVEALVDPDMVSIDQRIAAVDETNTIANLVKSHAGASEELFTESAKSTSLTNRLAGIKDLKGRLIAEAGLPVPGLGFSDGEVTYNDLPLSQASGREQIEISCAICMAQHPAIGILTVDVGWSELDTDGKEVLMKWAQQVGAQVWVTRVTDEMSDGGFFIEDGELVAIEGVPVAAGGNGDARTEGVAMIIPETEGEPAKPSWML